MRSDTPPPEDEALSDGVPAGMDDIEIIEYYEYEEPDSEDTFDEATLTFSRHSAPVFCVAVDKTNSYAVTGGQDDTGYVWNPRTGETVLECKGHTDSVTHVGFNHDSKYVATADMSGIVQVWDILHGRSTTTFHHNLEQDLRCLEWNPCCNALFAGDASGSCWLWHIPSAQTKVFQGNNVGVSCGRIMPSGLVSVVGYDDGSIQFLDLKATTTQHKITGPSAHEGSITTIDCHTNNTLVLTGSVDGTAKVVKSTDGRVLFTLRCEPEDVEIKSVETAGFFTSQPLIATGTVCGSLAIWDMPTQVRRLQCEQESGITKLLCESSGGPMVYTAGIDGVVRLMDARTGQQEKMWGGHTAAVLDFAVSNDKRNLVTCSDDGTCKVFETRT